MMVQQFPIPSEWFTTTIRKRQSRFHLLEALKQEHLTEVFQTLYYAMVALTSMHRGGHVLVLNTDYGSTTDVTVSDLAWAWVTVSCEKSEQRELVILLRQTRVDFSLTLFIVADESYVDGLYCAKWTPTLKDWRPLHDLP